MNIDSTYPRYICSKNKKIFGWHIHAYRQPSWQSYLPLIETKCDEEMFQYHDNLSVAV